MNPALRRQPAFIPSPTAELVLAESAGDAAFATTLAKGLVVLEAFDADAPMLGNMELSARTGIPRPTVARLTHTLAELGYLRYDQDLAKYRLGARALRMVRPLLASMKFRQVARPLMQELAQSVRGTVSIGLLDGTAMIYVEFRAIGRRRTAHSRHRPADPRHPHRDGPRRGSDIARRPVRSAGRADEGRQRGIRTTTSARIISTA